MLKPVLKELKPTDELYHKLDKISANRAVSSAHIKNLIWSMKCYPELLTISPIIICKDPETGEWKIIDGQHRWDAAATSSLPVHVLIVDPMFRKMIGHLNSFGRNWTIKNFAKWYAVEYNNRNYQKFLELLESNLVTPGVLIAICQKSHVRDIGNGGNRDFKDGKLEINKYNITHIEDTLYKLRQIEYASCNPSLRKATIKKKEFSQAFLHMFAKERSWYDHNEFLRKLSSTDHFFGILSSKVDMINEILRIMGKK
mgnify:CR=1 FL=1